MTTKQIQAAAKKFAMGNIPIAATKQEIMMNAFICGVMWFKKHIWHPGDEIPEFKRNVLILSPSSCLAAISFEDVEHYNIFKSKFGIEQWLYIEELTLQL